MEGEGRLRHGAQTDGERGEDRCCFEGEEPGTEKRDTKGEEGGSVFYKLSKRERKAGEKTGKKKENGRCFSLEEKKR